MPTPPPSRQKQHGISSDRSSYAETKFGLGLPIKTRPEENLDTYTKVNYAGRPIYQVGISFFKIALLISYLRLLKGTDQKHYRMVVWGIIVIVFFGHLACAFALIFACTPVRSLEHIAGQRAPY